MLPLGSRKTRRAAPGRRCASRAHRHRFRRQRAPHDLRRCSQYGCREGRSMTSPERPACHVSPCSTTSRPRRTWSLTGATRSKRNCSARSTAGRLGSGSSTRSAPWSQLPSLARLCPGTQRVSPAAAGHRDCSAGGGDRDDLRPRVIADSLLAVYAATFDTVQRRIVAGEHPGWFIDDVLDHADATLDLLRDGINAYP